MSIATKLSSFSILARRNGRGSRPDDHAATPNDLLSRRNTCGLRNNQTRERNKADRQLRR